MIVADRIATVDKGEVTQMSTLVADVELVEVYGALGSRFVAACVVNTNMFEDQIFA